DLVDLLRDFCTDLFAELFALAVVLLLHDGAALVLGEGGNESAEHVAVERPFAEHGGGVPDAPDRRSLAGLEYAQLVAVTRKQLPPCRLIGGFGIGDGLTDDLASLPLHGAFLAAIGRFERVPFDPMLLVHGAALGREVAGLVVMLTFHEVAAAVGGFLLL